LTCVPRMNLASAGEDATRRCRHAVASVGPFVFIYGGLKGSTLLDDLLLADDSAGTELTICDPRTPSWSSYLNTVHGSAGAAQVTCGGQTCVVLFNGLRVVAAHIAWLFADGSRHFLTDGQAPCISFGG